MTVRKYRGDVMLSELAPDIINYTGYAENTDIWTAATKTVIHFFVTGPTLAVKSYGGQATVYLDGVSSLALDGLGTTGNQQSVAVGAGLVLATIQNPVDANGGRSYAFAWADVGPLPATTFAYSRGNANLAELTPDISNYLGYARPTDIWTTGTKTLMTFTAQAGSVLIFYCYGGGTAKLNFGGAFQQTIGGIVAGTVTQIKVTGAGAVSVTLTDPQDGGSSFAFALVEEYSVQTGLQRLMIGQPL